MVCQNGMNGESQATCLANSTKCMAVFCPGVLIKCLSIILIVFCDLQYLPIQDLLKNILSHLLDSNGLNCFVTSKMSSSGNLSMRSTSAAQKYTTTTARTLLVQGVCRSRIGGIRLCFHLCDFQSINSARLKSITSIKLIHFPPCYLLGLRNSILTTQRNENYP